MKYAKQPRFTLIETTPAVDEIDEKIPFYIRSVARWYSAL
jgi:hypothetical protein